MLNFMSVNYLEQKERRLKSIVNNIDLMISEILIAAF